MKSATAVMAVKTDRNDARAIAQAIRVGWYTAVHVKTTDSQELRLLLTNRRTLLATQLILDNEVRGTLKAFGLKMGAVTPATFERRVIALLTDRPRLLAMVAPMLAARDGLRRQFAVLHRMMLRETRDHPACPRLMTVPGVGAVVALTYATAIDAPERFRHSRDVGAHFGLTPRKYASGEMDRNGRISKRGYRIQCSLNYAKYERTTNVGHGHAATFFRPKLSGRRPAGIAAARSHRKSPENAMWPQPTGEVCASSSSGTSSPIARRCATASAI